MPRYQYTCTPVNPQRHHKGTNVTVRILAPNDSIAKRAAQKCRAKIIDGPVHFEELQEGRVRGRDFVPERSIFRNQNGSAPETPDVE